MIINIGTIIKDLRKENNVTQETLAVAVGVTPQAISRWEAGGSYPDIELLPSLADFFSVSTDELLGYKMSEREKHLAEVKEEMYRIAEFGKTDERLEFVRAAFAKYPSDCEIRQQLSVCLSNKYIETNEKALLDEAESLSLYVVENCKDADIYYDAINTLIWIYSEREQTDKALEMLERLTPMKYCRELSMTRYGIGDGNGELYDQDVIDKLTDFLGMAIRGLVLDNELPNDPSTWDKKIKMLATANEIYSLIYGEDMMFYHCRVGTNYRIMATYLIAQGKTEETLTALEKSCEHTIAYDRSYLCDHGKNYTSIFVDKITYPEPGKDFHELKEHSQSWVMLDRLQQDRYDSIRNDERFIAIEKALREYER
ncbi:MAG: helix-turn-helix transcriptional regulator [Clostridia bacterium]|nr:helix-turn-helix transcriptional regulator [Clostridia bacterium]